MVITDDKCKKIINITLISIISNVTVFFVLLFGFIIAENLTWDISDIVIFIIGVLLIAIWPLINLILSIIALVFSVNNSPKSVLLAIIEISLSIAGPILYGLSYLLESIYSGV